MTDFACRIRLRVLLFALLLGVCCSLNGCASLRAKRDRQAAIENAAEMIRSAKTHEEQSEAFYAAKNCPPPGYGYRFYDSHGTQIAPPKTGRYEDVVEVEVFWDDGPSVRIKLIDIRSLTTLMGA